MEEDRPLAVDVGQISGASGRSPEPPLATSPGFSARLLAAQSDQQLLALLSDGHERAFEAMVRRYRRPLLRYCRRLRLSHVRAEDVLQHAFLQAWLALAAGRQVRDLKPWLYRIVHNTALNAIRDGGEDHVPLSDAPHARELAGECEQDRRVAMSNALTHVAALPQMQRRAIVLSALDGHTHDEVASELGISDDAVRGLLYRARRTLRGAAAAITPQPLVGWAWAGAGRVAATSAGVTEVSSGGGASGMMNVLARAAAVAFTAGTLASGAAVLHLPRPASRNSRASGATSAQHGVPAGRSERDRAPIDSASAPTLSRYEGVVGSGERLHTNLRARGDGRRLGSPRTGEAGPGARAPNQPRWAAQQGTDLGGQGADRPGASRTGREHAIVGSGDGGVSPSLDGPGEESGGDASHVSPAGAVGSAATAQSPDRSGDRRRSADEGQHGQLVAADGSQHEGARLDDAEPVNASSGRGG